MPAFGLLSLALPLLVLLVSCYNTVEAGHGWCYGAVQSQRLEYYQSCTSYRTCTWFRCSRKRSCSQRHRWVPYTYYISFCCHGYQGPNCHSYNCYGSCGNGWCGGPARCSCHSGWRGDRCDQWYCPDGCVQGWCVGANRCRCQPGWRGSRCEQWYCPDGCGNGRCVGANRCSCNSGWTGSTCNTDVNECQHSSTCHQICSNTAGSYRCSCYNGYQLRSDQHNCEDFNECNVRNGGCQHVCSNTVGSYGCSCNHGYRLGRDEHNCEEIDECAEHIHNCDQNCHNTAGSYYCDCYTGYRLAEDRHSCLDIDECAESSDGCHHSCHNTIGSYFCSCDVGYQLVSDQHNCVDVDECSLVNGGCEQNCHNMIGSYSCSCNIGFELADNLHDCPDVDECERSLHTCPQRCGNIIGSYFCFCNSGYYLDSDGQTCIEFTPAALNHVPTPNPASQALLENVSCAEDLCQCVRSKFARFLENDYIQGGITDEGNILKAFLNPQKLLTAFDILSGFTDGEVSVVLPVDTRIELISYDCTEDTLSIRTFPGGEILVFPTFITLSNVVTSAVVRDINSPMADSVTFEGEVSFGGTDYIMRVIASDSNVRSIEASFSEEGFNLFNLLDDFGSSAFGQILSNSRVSVTAHELRGSVSATYILLHLQCTVSIGRWFEASSCVIIYQPLMQVGISSPKVAVATGCGDATVSDGLDLSTVVEQLLGIQIGSFPFFGNLELPSVRLLWVSEGFPDETLTTSYLQHLADALSIAKGISFLFNSPFSNPSLQLAITFDRESFSITPVGNTELLARDVIEAVKSNLGDVLSASILDNLNVLELAVTDFSLDITQQLLNVTVLFNRGIHLLSNRISLTDIAVHLSVRLCTSELIVSLTGNFYIGDTQIPFMMRIDAARDMYTFESYPRDIGSAEMENVFSFVFPPVIKDNLNIPEFVIRDARFKLSSGTSHQLCFSGSVLLFHQLVHAATCIILQDGTETQLVAGIELQHFSLTKLLSKFIGNLAREVVLLNHVIDISIVYSSGGLSQSPLSTLLPSQMSVSVIPPGVTVGVDEITWPDNCARDIFCNIARFFLGRVSFSLDIHFVNGYFSVDASVGEVEVGPIRLDDAGLSLEVDLNIPDSLSLGVFGVVNFPSQGITLRGGIKWQTPSVIFEVATTGCWEQAFGLPFLDLCNIYVAVRLTASTPSGLAFAGTAVIGIDEPSCGVVEVTAAISLDAANPIENFFYAQQDEPLTIQSVLRLFCINLPLPPALGQSHFPSSYELSFSPVERYLPHLRLEIPSGFFFQGPLYIMGFTVYATLEVDYQQQRYTIETRLPPLNLAGVLRLQESRDNRNHGPFLVARLEPSNIDVTASGYLTFLGSSAEASLHIDNEGYSLVFSLNLLSFLDVDFNIKGSFTLNILYSDFQLSGTVHNKFSDYVIKEVKKKVNNLASFAEDVLRPYQRAAAFAKEAVNKAKAILGDAVEELNHWKRELDKGFRVIEHWRRQVRSICSLRDCPKVGVSYPCGLKCSWSRGCRVKFCSIKVDEPLCAAANAACRLLRAPFELLLDTAKLALEGITAALSLAQEVLRVAEEALEVTSKVLDAANHLLDQTTKFVGPLANYALAVLEFGLDNILIIKKVHLEQRLAATNGLTFSASVEMTIIGINVKWSGKLQLDNPIKLIEYAIDYIKDRASGGIGRKKRDSSPYLSKPTIAKMQTKVQKIADWYQMSGNPFPKKY